MSVALVPKEEPVTCCTSPYSQTLCNLGTITYAIDSAPLTAITAGGSIVFGARGFLESANEFHAEWNRERKATVLTELAAKATGFALWLVNGIVYLTLTTCQVAARFFQGAKAIPAQFLQFLATIGPITGILAAGILLIVDTKTIACLLIKAKRTPEENKQLKMALISWLANAAMLIGAALVFGITMIGAPEAIVILGLFATFLHIYAHMPCKSTEQTEMHPITC